MPALSECTCRCPRPARLAPTLTPCQRRSSASCPAARASIWAACYHRPRNNSNNSRRQYRPRQGRLRLPRPCHPSSKQQHLEAKLRRDSLVRRRPSSKRQHARLCRLAADRQAPCRLQTWLLQLHRGGTPCLCVISAAAVPAWRGHQQLGFRTEGPCMGGLKECTLLLLQDRSCSSGWCERSHSSSTAASCRQEPAGELDA